jgi:hypothetical protein
VSHPDEQRKLQQASNKKAEQGARLFNILPDVFVFTYARCQGTLVTLTFRPDPNFQPPSIEARVLHSMQGEMTVETKHERLAVQPDASSKANKYRLGDKVRHETQAHEGGRYQSGANGKR